MYNNSQCKSKKKYLNMCHRVRLGASDGFSSEQRFRLRRRRYGQKNPQRPHHPPNQKLEKLYHFNALKIPNMGKGGRWDLFEKAANASLIPWNGSETLKFIPGQPQRKISCAPEVFSACTVPLISGMGAFYM